MDAGVATERLGLPAATATHLAIAQLAGDDQAAVATLERATAGAREAGDQPVLTQTRSPGPAADAGHREAARELLVAADRLHAANGVGEGADLARELPRQTEVVESC
jgi:poly(3-hydroxybutyrate) depolymerase